MQLSDALLSTHLGSWNISVEQQVKFFELFCQVGAMCRLTPSVGRGAKLLDSHILFHEDSLLSHTATNHTIARLASSVAKPVQASRAKIPTVAATVLPENFLKGQRRHIFQNQEALQQDD